MTDRELLERAARAAGLTLQWVEYADADSGEFPVVAAPGARSRRSTDATCWNPLEDDGDEARLEAELGLDVVWHSLCVFVGRKIHRNGSAVYAEEFKDHGGDKQAARRRAGVCAAAAMADLGGKT